ncbi:MAG TPA: cyclopropane fatty acyl phospholipid synthase [Pseudomonadales bacterium]|nr:cyclopropane fatty acyl phospholipid synthase [Pseudomonadales bacterium]
MTNNHERCKAKIEKLLAPADVRINGSRPWDIKVHDDRMYPRVLGGGSLAFGESYMDGWWDCEAIDELLTRILRVDLGARVEGWREWLSLAISYLINRQTARRSYVVGEQHYDVGNDLYERMLDERMIYSCGYWRNANNLDDAQEAKLDLACRKLGLKPGMRVLDIGCGWGGAARYAAETYGVDVVGVTISHEQVEKAEEVCAGLPVEIRLQDYRELDEKFDRIFSIGMFEHVGFKNYRRYMEVASRCLKENGMFLLHTIGFPLSSAKIDPWIAKYIFPNSMLPSVKQIGKAMENLFVMEDWHNFRADYETTLLAWYRNFNNNWAELSKSYDSRFRRMWNFYLLGSAAGFRSGRNQLWQIVMSKPGRPGGYRSIR